LFFISSSLVIRGPFSSLLPIFPSAPHSLLPRFQPSPHTLRNPLSRPEQPHLHGVAINPQHLRDLFHRKPLHFLQHQHRSVAFLQALQQLLHPLPPRQLLARIWVPVGNLFCRLVLPRLFLAQVHLQHQRPHFPLPQQVPTFVQRDLVQPRTERRPLIEPFQRKVRLQEDLLGYVFHVLPVPQYPSSHREHPALVLPDQALEGLLVPVLGAPDEFPVFAAPSRLRHRLLRIRQPGERHGLCFWDVCHRYLVTLFLGICPARPQSFQQPAFVSTCYL